MFTFIRGLVRSLNHDASRIDKALRTIEALPKILASNHSALLRQMTALNQILAGVDYILSENAALKAALGDSAASNEQLQADLAAAAARASALAAEEASEDALEQTILSRLTAAIPAPAPAPEPTPEPATEPEQPIAD